MNNEARTAAKAVEAKSTNRDVASYPTSGYLTELCHELVVEQWQLGKKFQVRRASDFSVQRRWLAIYADDNSPPNDGPRTLYPRWRRVRSVSYHPSGRLLCSCGNFERCGFPCRHQAAVIMSEDSTCRGFSHHDVAIMWWKKVAFFGMREGSLYNEEANKRMVDECIYQLMQNDIQGPSLDTSKLSTNVQESSAPAVSLFEIQAPENCCLNFTSNQIKRAIETFGSAISSAEQGVVTTRVSQEVGMMSQESHVAHEDWEENDGPMFQLMNEEEEECENDLESCSSQSSMVDVATGDDFAEPDNFDQAITPHFTHY